MTTSQPANNRSNGAVATPRKYPPCDKARNKWPMPLPSSRGVQNHTSPRATGERERTGTAQHHTPNVTRAAFTNRKPTERSWLTRLLTKRAGVNTRYSRVRYSSTECAPWGNSSDTPPHIALDKSQGLSHAMVDDCEDLPRNCWKSECPPVSGVFIGTEP